MSNNTITGRNPAQDAQMLLMQVEGEKDAGSAASNLAREAMEALNPANVLGGIAQILKALGSISG